MLVSTTHCSHCGTAFEADGRDGIYSIRVDSRGFLLEVMDGELIPGALHYCSPECMFKRQQGVTPENNIFDFAGL
ncbi:hypothetical protein [Geobacter sp. AOG2]|uniref:hypothetical protein n=1 Tax=Geobacter sp. AOG2 TaxID=1566347 RepID=UPI001CC7E99E|nr:hypothetical protein [Geobacter sp. AOG2]GFE61814.1 hypothetical protein AOG2_24020 [Geobacter sp. AOG2]